MTNLLIPPIRFSFASPGGARPFNEQLLNTPVPLARPTSGEIASDKITYRVYLQGIKAFILQNWDRFVEAVAEQAAEPVYNMDLIEIVAEKHGSDYHPARIRVSSEGRSSCFVMNVAITDRGKDRVYRDYHWLETFHAQFQNHYVPRAYSLARQIVPDIDGKEADLVMFLAEWLEGYHEFHLSRDLEQNKFGIVVWNMDQGYSFLPEAQSWEIYRQAAFILTYYYDVSTFREVFPWHHASGDFVVRLGDEPLNVKMITIRQYEPRAVFQEDAAGNAITALTIFLANLTLRMRLDRLDGVGDLAWAADYCVKATVQGFADAMNEKVIQGHCSQQLFDDLFGALAAMCPVDWAELFRLAVQSCDQSAPDVPVIIENLPDHVFCVYSAIQTRAERP